MANTAKFTHVQAVSSLRLARTLTMILLVLTAVVSAGGLLIPGLYRDTAWLVPQMRGQDLVTLLILPVLAWAAIAAGRGSLRAALSWIGLLGYVLYTYTGAAFAYVFNEFFLIYVAIFSLSIFALIAAVTSLNPAEVRRRFDSSAPRRSVVAFLTLIPLMLVMAYMAQILPFFFSGQIPQPIVDAGTPTLFIYVLDLGLIVPLSLLSAIWLWKSQPRGFILAGFMLIKAATMGLALLSMTWFSLRAGTAVDMGLTMVWVVVAAGGIGLSCWFLRHCRA